MKIHRSFMLCFALAAGSSMGCSDANVGETIAVTSEPLALAWFTDLNINSKETVVASRGSGLMDIFAVTTAGSVSYFRFSNGALNPGVGFGNPAGVTMRSIAVVNNGGRLDLVAAASNGKIYHKFQTNPLANPATQPPTFSAWLELGGLLTTTSDTRDKLAITSWGPGRLDLFFVTPAGNIGHQWADNYAWSGVESGDTGVPYLKAPSGSVVAPFEAVSSRSGRIDFMYRGPGNTMRHHWFDSTAGGWGSGASLHRQELLMKTTGCGGNIGVYTPRSFALASGGPGNLDLFTVERHDSPTIRHFMNWSSYTAGDWSGASGQIQGVGCAQIPGNLSSEAWFNDALNLGGTTRTVFGRNTANNLAWQAFLQ
jgi:hypothetical protein